MYRRHIFVCENTRDSGERCCGACLGEAGAAAAVGGGRAVKFLRGVLKAQGQHGRGRARVNRAGCFDRCEEGPVLVIYPDAVWYRYTSESDLTEIAESHIINGAPVERLRI